MVKTELYHDNFQNYKQYNIRKGQLVIADIPYNLGVNAYASNPMWYEGGATRTEKVRKPQKVSSMEMARSISQSSFISVISC